MEVGSYRSPSTILSEGVYQFLRGSIYGAIWGMVTPFHAPGSPGAIQEAKTGIFKPARPFSSLRSVGSNAAVFGSIMAVQRLSSKSIELLRQKEDWFNDLIAFPLTYKYYSYFIGSSNQRLLMHNRFIGGTAITMILYSNLA